MDWMRLMNVMCDGRTWPVNEQVIDILHKSVYSFFTGWLTDRVIQ